MDARQSFREAAAQTSRQFEMGFVAAAAAFLVVFTAGKALALMPSDNWASAVTSGSVVALHVWSLAYRRKFPDTFWAPVVVGWLDCLMLCYSHTALQGAFWEELYSPLGVGERPWRSTPVEHLHCEVQCKLAASIQTTFIFYVTISYLTTFVLQFSQGLLVNGVGIPSYLLLIWFSRRLATDQDVIGTLVIEVACLVLAALVSTVAKWRSDATSLQTFELLAREKKQTISEKVLRYQAEFAMSNMEDAASRARPHSDAASGLSALESGYLDSCAGSSCQPARCRKPESMHSAPAKLVSFLVGAQAVEAPRGHCSAGGDCLPTDATVWVEGEGAPRPLSAIGAGQKILCYDSLSQGVRYAAVLRVQRLPEPSNWVVVALADGTQLRMTADHQVKLAADAHSLVLGGSYVQAQDLVPGTSAVMVHKVVLKPVLVESVQAGAASASSGAEPGRMSVEVHHPEQYSILCAAPSGGAHAHANVRSVAVGSAAIQKIGLTEKNSFFDDFCDASANQPSALSRSLSEPPGHRLREPPTSQPDGSGRRSSASGSHNSSSCLSSSTSSSSGADISGADVSLVPPAALLAVGPDNASSSQAGAASEVASLRVFDARAAGRPSVGSELHDAGQCKPCFFQHKVGGCQRGVDCIFCHREDGHRVKRVRGKRFYV